MAGEFDFTCPECSKDYPLVARTTKGTCVACGSAKRSAGARKSLFVQRSKFKEQHRKYSFTAMRLHASLAVQPA